MLSVKASIPRIMSSLGNKHLYGDSGRPGISRSWVAFVQNVCEWDRSSMYALQCRAETTKKKPHGIELRYARITEALFPAGQLSATRTFATPDAENEACVSLFADCQLHAYHYSTLFVVLVVVGELFRCLQ